MARKLPLDLKETIQFELLKEHRGPYFVEYSVPVINFSYADLHLVYAHPAPVEVVARAMVAELEIWARRYPVPIMAFAFDDTGSMLKIGPARTADHVSGWIDETGQLVTHWRLLENEEIPGGPFTNARILEAYPDIPYAISTAEDKRKIIEKTIRSNRAIRNVVIVWFVGIPVAIAIIQQFNAVTSWIGFGVSLLTGGWELAKIKGWKKPSRREQEKVAEELRMNHHHYYCERNPEAFNRLKAEVIERELRAGVLKEDEELRKKPRQ